MFRQKFLPKHLPKVCLNITFSQKLKMDKKLKVKKAIIPVAGFGTRFLPATKAQPKEMIPLVDKPVIQYIVEEAVASGIKDIIFVTGRGKRAIEDHFDYSYELEHSLFKKGKKDLFRSVRQIAKMANFSYVRQPQPLGDGHAVLSARHLVNKEPVAILFGDDILESKIPGIAQLVKVYQRYQCPVIGLYRVPPAEVSRFGVVDPQTIAPRTFKLKKFVEKPAIKEAPSNLVYTGRAIITPEFFAILREKPRQSGEIRLADAFAEYIRRGHPIYGYELNGRRHDCGDKLGFLQATVEYGLKHPETGARFARYLKKRFSGK